MTLTLKSTNSVPWRDSLPDGATPTVVHFGRDDQGVGAVQVAVAKVTARPTKGAMTMMWKTRGQNTAMPVVVAAVSREGVWLHGPDEKEDPVGPVSVSQAERFLQSVLDEPHGIAAHTQLRAIRTHLGTVGGAGYVNHFLFATYHLRNDVPRRNDWAAAGEKAAAMLTKRGTELIAALGYETESAAGGALVLRGASKSRRAIAVLLDESENFDQKSTKYQLSPVAHGLEIAGREDVPWVIVLRKDTLRLYPGRDGVGVGQRGQSETYFELDLAFVDQEFAGLLPLIFSADALEKDGSAEEILKGSGKYAAELGTRLRDRVYEGVVPALAKAIADRLPSLGLEVGADGLQTAYALTMRILFRLLFQAYGESTELLPVDNENYRANSLTRFVASTDETKGFDEAASSVWRDLLQVWDAISNGNKQWGIPPYGGSLFDQTSPEGALIEKLKLPDSVMGPALRAMLTERTEDGVLGPVDFRSLQVREFGTIYEGLLESSLSLAEGDLTLDKNGAFVPAKEGDEIEARAGEAYFHSASGERKATGSYYTPKIVVDHLIERSIVPAIEAHLAKIQESMDAGREREAADAFFDFRVADLAMGSAHFLVAAVDKIERHMRDFLTTTPVPGVRAELARLAESARRALSEVSEADLEINEAQLLRRQVARRCVYGLDINPLAVELSQLAIWIHTFVPGLPMASLDHNLVHANSLTGFVGIAEALNALEPRRIPGASGFFDAILIDELETARARLLDFANATEADKAQVLAGARLLAEAKEASRTARAILDAAVAARSGELANSTRLDRDDLDDLLHDPTIAEVARHLVPGHFPYLFPEVFLRDDPGFDVIIGNPPWDKVRWEAAPFWAKISPGLMALPDSQRDARIEALRSERPVEAAREQLEIENRTRLQEYFKGGYVWRGGTHLELAQLMLERALRVKRSSGRLGLVLPRQSLVLAGWKRLRAVVLRDRDVSLVQARNSAGWMFEGVHASYAVVLLSVGPDVGLPVRVNVVNSAQDLGAVSSLPAVELSLSEIESFSDSMVIPWFDSAGDRVVFDKIRRGVRLSSPGGWFDGQHDARWDFRGTGPDRRLASAVPVAGGLSVMMTRHVDAYAIRPVDVKQTVVNLADMASKGRGAELDELGQIRFTERHPVVIFRHPSRSDDTRTLIAAALPSTGFIYNKGYVHAVAHAPGTGHNEILALIGLLGSNTEDWWARRFVDRHVTAPVINNLPLPRLTQDDLAHIAGHVAHLLIASGYQSLAGGLDLQERARSSGVAAGDRFEHLGAIEALVAFGHGLQSADLAVIREDFSPAGMPDRVYEVATEALDHRWRDFS